MDPDEIDNPVEQHALEERATNKPAWTDAMRTELQHCFDNAELRRQTQPKSLMER